MFHAHTDPLRDQCIELGYLYLSYLSSVDYTALAGSLSKSVLQVCDHSRIPSSQTSLPPDLSTIDLLFVDDQFRRLLRTTVAAALSTTGLSPDVRPLAWSILLGIVPFDCHCIVSLLERLNREEEEEEEENNKKEEEEEDKEAEEQGPRSSPAKRSVRLIRCILSLAPAIQPSVLELSSKGFPEDRGVEQGIAEEPREGEKLFSSETRLSGKLSSSLSSDKGWTVVPTATEEQDLVNKIPSSGLPTSHKENTWSSSGDGDHGGPGRDSNADGSSIYATLWMWLKEQLEEVDRRLGPVEIEQIAKDVARAVSLYPQQKVTGRPKSQREVEDETLEAVGGDEVTGNRTEEEEERKTEQEEEEKTAEEEEETAEEKEETAEEEEEHVEGRERRRREAEEVAETDGQREQATDDLRGRGLEHAVANRHIDEFRASTTLKNKSIEEWNEADLLQSVITIVLSRVSQSRLFMYTQGLHEMAVMVLRVNNVFEFMHQDACRFTDGITGVQPVRDIQRPQGFGPQCLGSHRRRGRSSTMLLMLSLFKSILFLERLCLNHSLCDFLTSPLELSMITSLKLIGYLLYIADPPLFSLLTFGSQFDGVRCGKASSLLFQKQRQPLSSVPNTIPCRSSCFFFPFSFHFLSGHEFQFCLSYLLTCFTHELLPVSRMSKNDDDACRYELCCRIWDSLLAGPPQLPLCLCVAILTHPLIRSQLVQLSKRFGILVESEALESSFRPFVPIHSVRVTAGDETRSSQIPNCKVVESSSNNSSTKSRRRRRRSRNSRHDNSMKEESSNSWTRYPPLHNCSISYSELDDTELFVGLEFDHSRFDHQQVDFMQVEIYRVVQDIFQPHHQQQHFSDLSSSVSPSVQHVIHDSICAALRLCGLIGCHVDTSDTDIHDSLTRDDTSDTDDPHKRHPGGTRFRSDDVVAVHGKKGAGEEEHLEQVPQTMEQRHTGTTLPTMDRGDLVFYNKDRRRKGMTINWPLLVRLITFIDCYCELPVYSCFRDTEWNWRQQTVRSSFEDPPVRNGAANVLTLCELVTPEERADEEDDDKNDNNVTTLRRLSQEHNQDTRRGGYRHSGRIVTLRRGDGAKHHPVAFPSANHRIAPSPSVFPTCPHSPGNRQKLLRYIPLIYQYPPQDYGKALLKRREVYQQQREDDLYISRLYRDGSHVNTRQPNPLSSTLWFAQRMLFRALLSNRFLIDRLVNEWISISRRLAFVFHEFFSTEQDADPNLYRVELPCWKYYVTRSVMPCYTRMRLIFSSLMVPFTQFLHFKKDSRCRRSSSNNTTTSSVPHPRDVTPCSSQVEQQEDCPSVPQQQLSLAPSPSRASRSSPFGASIVRVASIAVLVAIVSVIVASRSRRE